MAGNAKGASPTPKKQSKSDQGRSGAVAALAADWSEPIAASLRTTSAFPMTVATTAGGSWGGGGGGDITVNFTGASNATSYSASDLLSK